MIDIAKTTTNTMKTIARSDLHHHHLKGATPMVHSSQPTERSTSLSAVAKRPKATDSFDQNQGSSQSLSPGHVNTETPQPLRWSEFPITFSRKDHWVHIPDPGTYPLVINPIVDGAFLPKTLIDGGSSLNIIFTKTLRKMDFDFNKMTTCNEPFYEVVPSKAAYPIGCVCLLVTFGTKGELSHGVINIRGHGLPLLLPRHPQRPMLAKFMAIPHHTYLTMKMSVLNGILSVLGYIMVSYNCESATVELSKDNAVKAVATVMVTQADKINQTTLEVPAIKKVCLGLPDASKEVVIEANLHPN
jgi:hypothetical protein